MKIINMLNIKCPLLRLSQLTEANESKNWGTKYAHVYIFKNKVTVIFVIYAPNTFKQRNQLIVLFNYQLLIRPTHTKSYNNVKPYLIRTTICN